MTFMDQRVLVGDLVKSTVEAVLRRHPLAEFKPGTVIVDNPSSVKGIAVRLDDSSSVVYPDNVTGQPALLNERVMVMLAGGASLIVGRWIAPHIPHTANTNIIPGGARSMAAGALQNFPTDVVQVANFKKYRADTLVQVQVSMQNFWIDASATYINGFQLNGVDHEIGVQDASSPGRWTCIAFTSISGIPAGTYTIPYRHRVSASTWRCDSICRVQMQVTEISSV